jgi:hypothetical protein
MQMHNAHALVQFAIRLNVNDPQPVYVHEIINAECIHINGCRVPTIDGIWISNAFESHHKGSSPRWGMGCNPIETRIPQSLPRERHKGVPKRYRLLKPLVLQWSKA